MLTKLFIPLISLILLKNIYEFAGVTESVAEEFAFDHKELVCGRRDVYSRNLKDSYQYLASRFPDLLPWSEDEDESPIDCRDAAYAVYRENNPGLQPLYPNWQFLERPR